MNNKELKEKIVEMLACEEVFDYFREWAFSLQDCDKETIRKALFKYQEVMVFILSQLDV